MIQPIQQKERGVDAALSPCGTCRILAVGVHQCPRYDTRMHVFSGVMEGDTRYGQKLWCLVCITYRTPRNKHARDYTDGVSVLMEGREGNGDAGLYRIKTMVTMGRG